MTAEELQTACNLLTIGVYVVSGKAGDKINGMTCAWVTQASMVPPMVAVGIAKSHYTHELIQQGGAFAVSILAEGQQEIARSFGFVSGRDKDKYAGVKYFAGTTGCPILSECAGYLDCRLLQACDCGDDTLFVGEVVSAGIGSGEPMPFRRDDYFK